MLEMLLLERDKVEISCILLIQEFWNAKNKVKSRYSKSIEQEKFLDSLVCSTTIPELQQSQQQKEADFFRYLDLSLQLFCM